MRKIYLLIISLITVCCIITGTILNVGGVRFGSIATDIVSVLPFSVGSDSSDVKGSGSERVFDEKIDSIQADVGVISIKIIESDRNAISWDFTNEKLIPSYSLDGGLLSIKQHKVNKVGLNVLSSDNKCELVVEVADDLDEIEINNGVGVITIEDVEGDYLYIDNGTGEVTLSDCEFEHIDIDNGVGEVMLSGVDDHEEYSYELDAGMGEITIAGDSYGTEFNRKKGDKTIRIDNGVGDIVIE